MCQAIRRLHVYQDGTTGGEWAHCRACSFTGDMIQLAARSWKLDTSATLRKLVDAQIGMSEAVLSPTVIRDYERDHVKYHQRIDSFWQEARKEHPKGGTADLMALQRRYNTHRASEDWLEKGGQFIGSTSKTKVAELLSPKRQESSTARVASGGNTSGAHKFKGQGWRDLLAMPFYDVPGRICGFLFIGRHGNPESDFCYRQVTNMSGVTEAGLAMLDALCLPPMSMLGRTGFIFTDPKLAMLLQMRYMKDHFRPLPLAIPWLTGGYETRDVWDWLGHEDLVFWGIEDPAGTILHAKRAGARVALPDVPDHEVLARMRHHSPEDWLYRMKQAARPWASALRHLLGSLPKDAVEATLWRMELQGRELSDFIRGCPEELRERLEHIESNRTYASRVRFENRWLAEKGDGWYLVKGNDRICNAVIRIEQVLTTSDHRSYHRGTIKFAGHSHPFTAKADILEKGLFRWAQSYLRDELRVGVLEYYPSWNTRSFQLALAFHTPEFAHGVEAIGWDAKNRQFNFPKFSICRGGNVTSDYACLFDHEQVPARSIPQPGSFSRKHVEALGDTNDETTIFWAMAAAVSSNLLAPAMNQEPVGVLLDGEGSQAIGGMAADRLGCSVVRIPKNGNPLDSIRSQTKPHLWPAILCDARKLGAWLDEPETQNVITFFPWATNCVLMSRGRWNLIRCDRKLGSMQLVQHAAPYVLPNYLQDVYRRNLLIADDCTDLVINVIDDMAGWFESIGGNRDAVDAARSVLLTPSTCAPWQHFLNLIFRLYRDGKLKFTRSSHDDVKQQPHAIVSIDGETPMIWVSQHRFSDAVRDAGSLPPDLLLITKSLKEQGALVAEAPYKDEQGWLVHEPWWHENLEIWRSK